MSLIKNDVEMPMTVFFLMQIVKLCVLNFAVQFNLNLKHQYARVGWSWSLSNESSVLIYISVEIKR